MQRVQVGRRRAADLLIQEAPPGLWDAGPWGQEGKWLEASGMGSAPGLHRHGQRSSDFEVRRGQRDRGTDG